MAVDHPPEEQHEQSSRARKALAATVRYLQKAEHRFGRADLAVVSYHMGIGNLQQVLSDYNGGNPVPYAQLYFDTAPDHNPATYRLLSGFGDQSSLYYWRVQGAVQVMKLADTIPLGDDTGTPIPEAGFDLISAEVTLLNTGSSQYTLTLNNWFTALPGNSTALEEARERAKEKRADGGAWPRFKYNDFQVFRFGMRLRIEMRYWPDVDSETVSEDAGLRIWIPVISGPITEMTFSFSASEGARLTIVGEDDLRILKDKSPRRVQYQRRSEQEDRVHAHDRRHGPADAQGGHVDEQEQVAHVHDDDRAGEQVSEARAVAREPRPDAPQRTRHPVGEEVAVGRRREDARPVRRQDHHERAAQHDRNQRQSADPRPDDRALGHSRAPRGAPAPDPRFAIAYWRIPEGECSRVARHA